MPRKYSYGVCPKCGGKKWNTSELCKKCWTPSNKGKGWSTVVNGNKVICVKCKKRASAKPLENCPEGHFNSYENFKKGVKRRQDRDRLVVLNTFGGKCACCGFSDLNKKVRGVSFMQVDHINGKGRQHFINLGSRHMVRWLYHKIKIEGKIPRGFRLLCIACNAAMEPGEKVCELHKWENEKTRS